MKNASLAAVAFGLLTLAACNRSNPDALNEGVAQAMQPPLHVIDSAESVDRVFADLTAGSPAVVVAQNGRPSGMLTRSDLLEYLAHTR